MSANPAVQSKRSSDEVAANSGLLLRSILFPIILRPSRRLDDDELLEFCAANDPLRIERNPAGELIVMTPAGGKTSNREGYLSRKLDLWAESEGRGIAFNSNGGFSLPDGSVRAPDAAWLSGEKWRSLTPEEQGKFVPFCPEFVVELRSPSDNIAEVEQKMTDWIANGTYLAWLIDPLRKVAMIDRPGQEPKPSSSPNPSTAKVPSRASSSKCSVFGSSYFRFFAAPATFSAAGIFLTSPAPSTLAKARLAATLFLALHLSPWILHSCRSSALMLKEFLFDTRQHSVR
jgi:Uma2 family endonuclease